MIISIPLRSIEDLTIPDMRFATVFEVFNHKQFYEKKVKTKPNTAVDFEP